MQLVKKIKGWFATEKSASDAPVEKTKPELNNYDDEAWRVHLMSEIASPYVADRNFLTLFHTVPEVFFPIDFIARRIAGAHFEIRSYKDDSIVYCNGRSQKADRLNAILQAPNSIQRWRELVYMHHVFKLVTGNAFMRAAMADTFKDMPKWKYCDNFWSIPSNWVKVVPAGTKIPLFGIAKLEELVGGYELARSNDTLIRIPTFQVWHDRDGMPQYLNCTGADFLKSESRLKAAHRAISNLIAVYEARNVIYVKRGALGFIVAKKDGGELGTQAMKPKEKEELLEELNGKYGFGDNKMPIGVTDVPIEFIRLNQSISELQPFEETLLDAITIAGLYGIPDVLVPRKDHSTFSNQAVAEKSAYCGTIIPMAKQFCEDLTLFLGLDKEGYYIDCNFNDVDCLQVGLKESEEVKKLVNERCRNQFNDGLITYNDWRAQIHETALEGDIYNKVKFDMTPEELAKIDTIIKSNNSKPSTGEENNERDIEKNPVSDQNG